MSCVFCAIVRGEQPADIVFAWPRTTAIPVEVFAIVPLNPVTPGHVLIIPETHVEGADDDPVLTGQVFQCAAEIAGDTADDFNLIVNAGPTASQTVPHLHVHYVPRREGDGLLLPWSGQAERLADEAAQRAADELVAPEPVCTCEDHPNCSIHVWEAR